MKVYFWLILAVVQTTAFFLSAKQSLSVSFTEGKIEALNINYPKSKESIKNLVEGEQISFEDWICSGQNSRGEFSDNKNITYRLGSMSIVSFHKPNEFKLHSGSFLFCTKEKNTTFKFSSTESNASFIGSGTIILEATSNGGFKFLPVEARGKLITDKGGTKIVQSGQMILVLDQPSIFGDAYDIDLMLLIKSSPIIYSFPTPLNTFGRISLAVYSQELRMKSKFKALIGDATSKDNLQVWTFEK